jgi:tetratricopeptide (TPR) repeat protein
VLGEMERYEEAIDAYKKAVELRPKYPEAYYNMGVAYSMLQRYQDAILSFEQTVKLDKDFGIAYRGLGESYLNMENFKLAREMLEKAATLLIKKSDDTEDAKEILENIDKREKTQNDDFLKDMKDAKAHYKLGTVLAEMERYEEAIKAYDEAIRIKGKEAPFYYFYNRGLAYRRLGLLHKATLDLNRAIQIDIGSEFSLAHRELAEVLLSLGKNKESSKEFYRAGILFLREGKTNDALYCFMNVKMLDPTVDISLVNSALARNQENKGDNLP